MPRTPIHPGEILGDELKEIGISAAELARMMGDEGSDAALRHAKELLRKNG